MLKKISGMILILMLFLSNVFAQGEANPNPLTPPGTSPFIAGNDTLFSNTNLNSVPLQAGKFIGAWNIDFKFTLLGDSANYIDVYYKWGTAYGWGVPYDSLGVDSLYLGRVDSTYVADGDPFSFQLYLADWWGWHQLGQIILDPPASIDSIKVECTAEGQ